MIQCDEVFEETKSQTNKKALVDKNEKALSSNNILVEDGRMSRSKRKSNLKTLFNSEGLFNGRKSMSAINSTRKILKAQSSVDDDGIEAFEPESTIDLSTSTQANTAKKFERLSKTATANNSLKANTLLHAQTSVGNKRNVSKSFTNLFSGVRTWFRSTNTSADQIDKSNSSNLLFAASICTSSGRKKNRTSFKKEKSNERDRSSLSSKFSDHESASFSMKRKSDRKRDSKKKVCFKFMKLTFLA